MSNARCVEGYTWGREEDRVWVDRGCQAEFVFTPFEEHPGGRVSRIESGEILSIRTDESIRATQADGRIFTGTAAEDVFGTDRRLAIPRGSSVELIVRVAEDRDLVIDLESVTVNGQRYAIDAAPERIESGGEVGANRRTGEYIGGGAALGAIIGAIAGGGKGAAIGAGAGAAGGAIGEIVTSGRELRIPAESVITFRIERPLIVGVPDRGSQGDQYHFHPRDER